MRSATGKTVVMAAASALALAGAVPTAAAAHDRPTTISIQDNCDPASFDAALHDPHACDPAHEGRVTFAELVAALTEDPAGVLEERDAEGWRFDPSETSVTAGRDLVATNSGGEAHTFTQVGAFAGGCVPQLNAFFGFTSLAPSVCNQAFAHTLVLPGMSLHASGLKAGKTYHFQCLIHPWMRTTVRVK